MANPFEIVKTFEQAVAEYTGAPYCVAVNSCTNALFLCLAYEKQIGSIGFYINGKSYIEIPKHTYISVPMQIKHTGFNVKFRDENWSGIYNLGGTGIFDSARRFTSDMWLNLNLNQKKIFKIPMNEMLHNYMCVSFHWSKILGIQQGGAILHNDLEFDTWARKARFDGRTEGVAPKDDKFDTLGYHMYLSPEIAAEGLVRLYHLPKHNPDLPNDEYPDLSKLDIFK